MVVPVAPGFVEVTSSHVWPFPSLTAEMKLPPMAKLWTTVAVRLTFWPVNVVGHRLVAGTGLVAADPVGRAVGVAATVAVGANVVDPQAASPRITQSAAGSPINFFMVVCLPFGSRPPRPQFAP